LHFALTLEDLNMKQLISRLGRAADPPWMGAIVLGAAVVIALLSLVAENAWYDRPGLVGNATPLAATLIGVYLLAWGLEFFGLLRARWLFAALALPPVSGLLYGGRDTLAPLLPMLVGLWLAYTAPRRQAFLGLLLPILSIAPPFLVGRGEVDNAISWSIGCAFCWLLGVVLASQRRTLLALRAAQADLARQAVAEERRRLARDLHDVVAHTLAVTMLQLTGARRVLQRDPARAEEALAQAETLGRQSLADLRRAVSLLADSSADGRAEPVHGAADIPALAAEFARAGMALTSACQGPLETVPAGLGLDLYRVAQEALANAAKHAPGHPVQLQLRVEEAAVRLRVQNELPERALTPDGSDGHGLAGMRARAASHHGRLTAEADESGWVVEASFPLQTRAEAVEVAR
jgi:signal transduction histidine kinase